MKKPFMVFVILLLVSLVSMVMISQVYAPDPRIYVDPSSITGLQPETVKTIRPNGDGTFTDWTKRTVVIRPNSGGTYGGWTGRVLALNPDGEGAYRQWAAWTNLQPRLDGNYTGWFPSNAYTKWNDWPNPDGDSSYVYTSSNNRNQTSVLTTSPTERRGLTINKVRVNIVARQTTTGGDEQVQMILCTVFDANVTSFSEAPGWNGWTRVGNSPWLNKEDYSSNYIYTPNSVTVDKIGNFTFDDVPADITWSAAPEGDAGVQLRLKTWQSPGGDDTITIHLYNGTHWKAFSLTQGPPPAVSDPKYAEYREIDVSTFLNTVTKINDAKMAIERVTVGTADTIYVDYACIHLAGARRPSSYGLTVTPPTTYTHYYSDWSTNPITGLAWTWSDVYALQAGVRSVQGPTSWSGSLRVTQLYVGILTSQGLYTDWSDWPAATGPNGGDGDYFTTTAGELRQSSTLTNHATEDWPITKVRLSIVARANMSTDEKVQLMLSSPATFEANVDGFTLAGGWGGWTRVGSPNGPWLDAADYDSNYISTSADRGKIGDFSFGNVPAGITWSTVTLSIKTWKSGGDDTITVELYDGASWGLSSTFSPTSTTAPGDYVNIDVSTFLNTETKINAAKLRITKNTVTKPDDIIYVDHALLRLSGVTYGNSLTTTYTEYTCEWSTNPATGLAWTWSDIDNLEAGVKSIQTGISWTGEIRVTQLYVRVIEVANYALWDDSPDHNGDTDYVSAISGGLSQSSGLEDTPDPGWTIARVQVTIVARAYVPLGVTPDEKVKIMLVIGGTQYPAGLSNTPTTSYLTYSYAWGTNPAWKIGGIEQPWNFSAINSLEAGVQSIQGGTSWVGEIRVTQLYVVVGEVGTYDDWNDSPGDNGDTDYVSATMGQMHESSALEDVASPPSWDIARVRVVIVARTDVASDEQVQLTLVIGGYEYYGTKHILTATYATYSSDWGMNPSSGAFWDWSAVNSLEAGVLSIQTGSFWTGEIRVTQLYVEVAGPRFSVDIKIDENVIGLCGYDFLLKYNTVVLSATAIKISNFFSSYFTYKEEVNDASGYAEVSIVSQVGGKNGPGTLATIYFLVDSIGATPLDLCIKALSDPEGKEIHWILGDVDGDRTVDASDLSALSNGYGSQLGDSNWNGACDFNSDGKVDSYDLFDVGRNYGKTYSYDGYFSNI